MQGRKQGNAGSCVELCYWVREAAVGGEILGLGIIKGEQNFMKSIAIILMASLLLMSCGSDRSICMDVNGKKECHEYSQYGLIDQNENQNPKIKYRLI